MLEPFGFLREKQQIIDRLAPLRPQRPILGLFSQNIRVDAAT
jgi:hypothetical protein